jgi:hypothetical protein
MGYLEDGDPNSVADQLTAVLEKTGRIDPFTIIRELKDMELSLYDKAGDWLYEIKGDHITCHRVIDEEKYFNSSGLLCTWLSDHGKKRVKRIDRGKYEVQERPVKPRI